MCCRRRLYRCVISSVLVLAIQSVQAGPSAEDTVRLIADRLQQSQSAGGAWPDEEEFAGSATVGMVCAYEWLGETSYYSSAWRGGYYIIQLTDFQGNMLGDEAYAFTRLSDAFSTGVPPSVGTWGSVNLWYNALREFYNSVRHPDFEGTTEGYLHHFDADEPSTAVFYLAHHVIATYYINDVDKVLWRDALIKHLSRVDDDADFPVLALAAATWALAKVGALDADTPVANASVPQWRDVVLADLPALLMSHQVPEGEPFAGSFYCRFDHTSGGIEGPAAGYTEDAMFGALGLVAAASGLDECPAKDDFTEAIAAAQEMLLQGVGVEGEVYEHVSRQGDTYHAFAGELLQTLWSVKQYQDARSAVQEEHE